MYFTDKNLMMSHFSEAEIWFSKYLAEIQQWHLKIILFL